MIHKMMQLFAQSARRLERTPFERRTLGDRI